MKAIIVKYYPATRVVAPRVRAMCEGLVSVTVWIDDSYGDIDRASDVAVRALMLKTDWKFECLARATLPNGDLVYCPLVDTLELW